MKLQSLTRRKRLILAFTVLLIGLVIGAGLAIFYTTTHQEPVIESIKRTPEKATETPVPAKSALRFAMMGDMLAHDSVVNQVRTADSYDFSEYFSEIKPLYNGSDVVFCNSETPMAGEKFGISGYPVFNAPTELVRDLSKAGCNVINLANNHIADKGQPAIDATIEQWEAQKPLAFAGANRSADEQDKVRYFEKNGLKVAFLAFADFSNSTPPYSYSVNIYHDTELVKRLVDEARSEADVVLVSVHWGTEYSNHTNADQRKFAQTLTDLGVDVIVGTGPHVLQPVEWLSRADGGKTLVWYSIGNMLSSQLEADQLTGGVAMFQAAKEGDKIVISGVEFKPTLMSYQWSAADRAASRLSSRTDLKLQPLNQAQVGAERLGVTVDERLEKITQRLGLEVKIVN